MWEILTVIATLITVISMVGFFALIINEAKFVWIFSIGIILILVSVFTYNAINRSKQEKIDEVKSKCYLEMHDGDVIWNISSGTVTLDVHGVPFTLQVSDFKGKETRDAKEILYTPATMNDCFKQNR